MGGRRKSKRSGKSENVDPTAAELPRTTRSARSSNPVCVDKQGGQVTAQHDVNKSGGVFNREAESESWRRPLSVLDKNRGESLTSAADLSDSVFAESR